MCGVVRREVVWRTSLPLDDGMNVRGWCVMWEEIPVRVEDIVNP